MARVKIRKVPLNLYPSESVEKTVHWLDRLNITLKHLSYKAQYMQDTGDTYAIEHGKDVAYFSKSNEGSEEDWQYFLRYIKWFNERIYPQLQNQSEKLNVPR